MPDPQPERKPIILPKLPTLNRSEHKHKSTDYWSVERNPPTAVSPQNAESDWGQLLERNCLVVRLPRTRGGLLPKNELPAQDNSNFLEQAMNDELRLNKVIRLVESWNEAHPDRKLGIIADLDNQHFILSGSRLVADIDIRQMCAASGDEKLDVEPFRTQDRELVITADAVRSLAAPETLKQRFAQGGVQQVLDMLVKQEEERVLRLMPVPYAHITLKSLQGASDNCIERYLKECRELKLYPMEDLALERFEVFHRANGGIPVSDPTVLRQFGQALGWREEELRHLEYQSMSLRQARKSAAVRMAIRFEEDYGSSFAELTRTGKKPKKGWELIKSIPGGMLKRATRDVAAGPMAAGRLIDSHLFEPHSRQAKPIDWQKSNVAKPTKAQLRPLFKYTDKLNAALHEELKGYWAVTGELRKTGELSREIDRRGSNLFNPEHPDHIPVMVQLHRRLQADLRRVARDPEQRLLGILEDSPSAGKRKAK